MEGGPWCADEGMRRRGMAQITFDVPDRAIAAVSGSGEEFSAALRLAAAMFWYGRGEITIGTAAAKPLPP